MYMRLGFAVAIHVDRSAAGRRSVAVGDESFTHKCSTVGEIPSPRQDGPESSRIRSVWLSGSAMKPCGSMPAKKQSEGDPKRVVGAYLTAVDQAEKHRWRDDGESSSHTGRPSRRGDMFQATEGRWGLERSKSPTCS